MAADPPASGSALLSLVEGTGRKARAAVAEVGYASRLIASSLYWCVAGWRHGQPVRPQLVLTQMQEIGLSAIPIVAVMAATIGAMLAIQTIYSLRVFGAEYQVTLGVGFSVTREFAPLITAIVVSGRTSSALAARVGMMKINQEVDALRVMGIEPVRYLVAPALLACLIMVPCLTVLNGLIALAAGLYIHAELGVSFAAYLQQLQGVIKVNDVDRCLRVQGFDDVWALGDNAHIPLGDPNEPDIAYAPPLAQFAVREAKILAQNILAHLKDGTPRPFEYRSLGTMASLGGRTGVADILGVRITGFFAWAAWRMLYLSLLPSISTRARVAMDWLLDLIVSRNIAEVRTTRLLSRYIRFLAGDLVIEPGVDPGGLYVVISGAFDYETPGPSNEGTAAEPRKLGPGDCFGMLVSGGPLRRKERSEASRHGVGTH
jgi:phospholipid/cholesterol/gamma-HCH transport system permease protein